MAEFDLLDVVQLTALELHSASVVPRAELSKDTQSQQALKIQLFFFGRRVEKNAQEIISQNEIKQLRPLLGEKILIKFKVGEEVFKNCQQLGLKPGSKCDWDAMPQFWTSGTRGGVWYQPVALIRLDGKDINYQILKVKAQPKVNPDAFAYFDSSGNNRASSSSGWSPSLDSLENQINSELEGVHS